jgi:hypothetical protein
VHRRLLPPRFCGQTSEGAIQIGAASASPPASAFNAAKRPRGASAISTERASTSTAHAITAHS